MKISLDCEFTELSKRGELISIGLVAENGEKFYAEFIDFPYYSIENNQWIWLLDNVICNLEFVDLRLVKQYWDSIREDNYNVLETEEIFINNTESYKMLGTKLTIKNRLKEWLSRFDYVEIIADCGHYDFVFFIDLFGSAFNLPANVSPSYIELNNLIAQKYFISEIEAFNFDRKKAIESSYMNLYYGKQHNSLADAINQLTLYKIITK